MAPLADTPLAKKLRRTPDAPDAPEPNRQLCQDWLDLFRSPGSDDLSFDPLPVLHDVYTCPHDTTTGERYNGTFAGFIYNDDDDDDEPHRFCFLNLVDASVFASDEDAAADAIEFAGRYFPYSGYKDAVTQGEQPEHTDKSLIFAVAASLTASGHQRSSGHFSNLASENGAGASSGEHAGVQPALWQRIVKAGVKYAADPENDDPLKWLSQELREMSEGIKPDGADDKEDGRRFEELDDKCRSVIEILYQPPDS